MEGGRTAAAAAQSDSASESEARPRSQMLTASSSPPTLQEGLIKTAEGL